MWLSFIVGLKNASERNKMCGVKECRKAQKRRKSKEFKFDRTDKICWQQRNILLQLAKLYWASLIVTQFTKVIIITFLISDKFKIQVLNQYFEPTISNRSRRTVTNFGSLITVKVIRISTNSVNVGTKSDEDVNDVRTQMFCYGDEAFLGVSQRYI